MAIDPVLGWRNRADVHLRAPDPALRFEGAQLDTDERGLQRTPPADGAADPIRILCLGDSGTFGIWWKHVPDAELPALHGVAGFPHALVPELRRRGYEIEILNAGVIGYTSSHGLRQLTTLLRDLTPDITLVRFGYNDHGRAWNPALRATEPDSPWARGLLGSTGHWRLVRLALAGVQRVDWLQPAANSVPWVSPERFETNLRRLAEVLRERGSESLFLDYPLRPRDWGEFPEDRIYAALTGSDDVAALYRNHAEYQEIFARTTREAKLHALWSRPALTRREDQLFEPSDPIHLNGRGAKALAGLIATELESLGWLERSPGDG